MSDPPEDIPVTVDGGTLPVIEILTGRGFITGKSGSGKSVTASVIAEELLKADLGFLIVDTDGEYFGLKEQYEVLHVGADGTCDAEVGIEHAPLLAELALEEGVPIILDVSGYLDEDEVEALLERVVRELFVREKKQKKPFLLVVEEVHEYLPESGGLDDFGERLLQVAKRGRKRGLGMCAISQRPAAVDKDFITQCNWMVWHRLTWNNDTDVVRRIIDADAAETVETLENGEAILMTDWDEQTRRVKFRMRETVDVGQTPDFSDPEVPSLRAIDPSIVDRVEEQSATLPTDEDAAVDSDQDSDPETESTAETERKDDADDVASTATDDESDARPDTVERHASPRSSGASVGPTTQRDSLLLEVGDLMVYLFRVLRIQSGRASRAVRDGVSSATQTAAEAAGDGTPRQSSTPRMNWLVVALAVLVGLGVLFVLVG